MRCHRSGERTTLRKTGKTALLQEAGDRAVGSDHEVLDDLLGAIPFLGPLPAHGTTVELGPHLDRLEFQCASLVTAGLEALSESVLEPEVVGQPRNRTDRRRHFAPVLEPGAYARVGELGLVAYHCGVDA
jgi:hypothetical protein